MNSPSPAQPHSKVTNSEAASLQPYSRDLERDTNFIEVFLTEKENRDRVLSHKYRSKGIITIPGLLFEQSRIKELEGLLTQGVFETISVNTDKLQGTKVFGSRLVDKIKGKETLILYEKSCLIIQAFDNKDKRDILT